MIKYAITLLIALAVVAVSSLVWVSMDQEPRHIQLAYGLMKDYIAEYASPRNLRLDGYGGTMMEHVQQITLAFTSRDEVDVAQARDRLVACAVELLQRINNDKEMRPYLAEYPCQPKGIELSIAYVDATDRHIEKGKVAFTTLLEGSIDYSICDPSKDQPLHTIHRESFDDALKIVQEKRNKSSS